MLLLVRVITGEGWHLVMEACVLTPPDCEEHPPDGGGTTCGSVAAIPYFISLVLICTLLMLNLFVAIITDNFEYLTQDEAVLGPHHLDQFVEVRHEGGGVRHDRGGARGIGAGGYRERRGRITFSPISMRPRFFLYPHLCTHKLHATTLLLGPPSVQS